MRDGCRWQYEGISGDVELGMVQTLLESGSAKPTEAGGGNCAIYVTPSTPKAIIPYCRWDAQCSLLHPEPFGPCALDT